jgi:23S rRNA pseudouridine1911/1915/1917 synthase
MELRILHEESHFLIIDKPVGLFSQAAPGIPSVQTVLEEQLKIRDQHDGTPFVGLPHRLDRGTSGVMLIARNQRALKRFGEQFQSRKIGKYYLATVAGTLSEECEQWSDYVRKIQDQPRAEVCAPEDENAKLAQLTARRLANTGNASLLLIKLHTGRMHQIRIQAASRAMPLLGDEVYGGNAYFIENQVQDATVDQKVLGLHAMRLEIRHPQTAKPLAFTATPPTFWQQLPEDLQRAAEECVNRSRSEQVLPW